MAKLAIFSGAAAAVVAVALAGGAASAHPSDGGFSDPPPPSWSVNGPSVSADAYPNAHIVGDYKSSSINVRSSAGTDSPVLWRGNPGDYLVYRCSERGRDGHVWDYIQRLPNRDMDGYVRDDLVTWPGRWVWCNG